MWPETFVVAHNYRMVPAKPTLAVRSPFTYGLACLHTSEA